MSVPMPSDQDAIRSATLQGQIIIGALASGLIAFLVIVIILNIALTPAPTAKVARNGPGAPGAAATDSPLPLITYVAVATGAMLLPMSVVVPGLVTKKQGGAFAVTRTTTSPNSSPTPNDRSDTAGSPLSGVLVVYVSQLVIGAAMNEGAAFLALVAYMVEKNPIALAMAVILIAGVIARFPTTGRVERWIEQQRETLRQGRLDSRSSY